MLLSRALTIGNPAFHSSPLPIILISETYAEQTAQQPVVMLENHHHATELAWQQGNGIICVQDKFGKGKQESGAHYVANHNQLGVNKSKENSKEQKGKERRNV